MPGSIAPSKYLIEFAARFPAPTRLLLRLAAVGLLRSPKRAHWLFRSLKRRTRLRIQKKAHLFTGQVMWVDPFDSVGRDIFFEHCYEPLSVQIFHRLLVRGAVVVDAGAQLGQYSLLGSLWVGAEGRIHAFEPEPETYQQLRENLHANQCSNVVANRLALSDRQGEAVLHLSHVNNIGGTSLAATGPTSEGPTRVISTTTLDAYLEKHAITHFDVLKADVEGAELLLLHGAERIITRAHPHILMELSHHTVAFGYGPADVLAWLVAHGYEVFRCDALPLLPYEQKGKETHCNILAVHREKLAAVRSAGLVV